VAQHPHPAGRGEAANVTYLTMQVGRGEKDVRAMVVGIAAGEPGTSGWPPQLVAGRQITRGHYEAVADIATGFRLGDEVKIRRNHYTVVGLTRRMVSSSGDPMVFIPLKDAQEAQFLKDNDAILMQRRRTEANPAFNRPGVPGLLDAVIASQTSNNSVNAVLVRIQSNTLRRRWLNRYGAGNGSRFMTARRWKRFWWENSLPHPPSKSPCSW
jgi:putative ABC transport system permease protein